MKALKPLVYAATIAYLAMPIGNSLASRNAVIDTPSLELRINPNEMDAETQERLFIKEVCNNTYNSPGSMFYGQNFEDFAKFIRENGYCEKKD